MYGRVQTTKIQIILVYYHYNREKKAKLKEIHWNVRIRKTNYNEIILQFERRKKTVLSVRDIIRRTNQKILSPIEFFLFYQLVNDVDQLDLIHMVVPVDHMLVSVDHMVVPLEDIVEHRIVVQCQQMQQIDIYGIEKLPQLHM